MIRTRYERSKGRFDFPALAPTAPLAKGRDGKPDRQALGDFDTAYASAAVKLDETYHTSDESHSMMEPHATIAAWEGDTLTLWTANQMIDWARQGMAAILGIDPAKVRWTRPISAAASAASCSSAPTRCWPRWRPSRSGDR